MMKRRKNKEENRDHQRDTTLTLTAQAMLTMLKT